LAQVINLETYKHLCTVQQHTNKSLVWNTS